MLAEAEDLAVGVHMELILLVVECRDIRAALVVEVAITALDMAEVAVTLAKGP